MKTHPASIHYFQVIYSSCFYFIAFLFLLHTNINNNDFFFAISFQINQNDTDNHHHVIKIFIHTTAYIKRHELFYCFKKYLLNVFKYPVRVGARSCIDSRILSLIRKKFKFHKSIYTFILVIPAAVAIAGYS